GHEFGHYSKADDIDKSQDIANYTGGLLEKRTKNLASKEATEETLGAIRNNKNVITGEEGKKVAESIPMDRREYHTIEYFITGGGSGGSKLGFGKASITESYYFSFDVEDDKVTEYTGRTTSFGVGGKDIGWAIGVGIYTADNPQEMSKLNKSYGGSVTIKGISVGADILAENKSEMHYFSDLFNIRGVRIYAGRSKSQMELHLTTIDIGSIKIRKEGTILEYYKDKPLPYQIRNYYNNYYNNGGEKNR
uniref:hypothetical protein n=1 Tax=Fusobacterium russii TaxID=854 RepID=UPI0003B30B41